VGRERIPHPDPATIPTGPPGGRMPDRAWKSPLAAATKRSKRQYCDALRTVSAPDTCMGNLMRPSALVDPIRN
jgi:hypothetical protein